MRFLSLTLAAFCALGSVACGRLNGDGDDNSDSGGGNTPTGVPPPGPGANVQELVPLANLELTPTRDLGGSEVTDIEDLLVSSVVEVTGFREIILYGFVVDGLVEDPDHPGTYLSDFPTCTLSDGTKTSAYPSGRDYDVLFGMTANDLLKSSYSPNLGELSRHPVSGNWLSIRADVSNGSVSPVDPSGTPRPTIDVASCRGKILVKVVGVR